MVQVVKFTCKRLSNSHLVVAWQLPFSLLRSLYCLFVFPTPHINDYHLSQICRCDFEAISFPWFPVPETFRKSGSRAAIIISTMTLFISCLFNFICVLTVNAHQRPRHVSAIFAIWKENLPGEPNERSEDFWPFRISKRTRGAPLSTTQPASWFVFKF